MRELAACPCRPIIARGTQPGCAPSSISFTHAPEGSIVMQVRGGKEVTLTPGQTFYEGPNDVHTVGRNASMTKPAKFVVILLKKGRRRGVARSVICLHSTRHNQDDVSVFVVDTKETEPTIPFGN
jgi:cupin domain